MEFNLQKIFRDQKWFLLIRLVAPLNFILTSHFFLTDNLFKLFFVVEPIIIIISLIVSATIKTLNKPFFYASSLLGVLFLAHSLFLSETIIICYAINETINFVLSFGISRQLVLKRQLIYHFSSLVSLFFIILFSLEYYAFIFINCFLLLIINFKNKASYSKPTYLIKSPAVIAIIRNGFSSFSREIITDLSPNLFTFVALKFINQITLFVWSYLRSYEGIMISLGAEKSIWLKRLIYFAAAFTSIIIYVKGLTLISYSITIFLLVTIELYNGIKINRNN